MIVSFDFFLLKTKLLPFVFLIRNKQEKVVPGEPCHTTVFFFL